MDHSSETNTVSIRPARGRHRLLRSLLIVVFLTLTLSLFSLVLLQPSDLPAPLAEKVSAVQRWIGPAAATVVPSPALPAPLGPDADAADEAQAALLALQRGDVRSLALAQQFWRNTCQQRPRDAGAWAARADVSLAWAEALECSAKALSLQATHLHLHAPQQLRAAKQQIRIERQRAQAYLEDARLAAKRSIRLAPLAQASNTSAARALLARGNKQRARPYLARAASLAANDVGVLLAQASGKKGPEATAVLQRAAKRYPQDNRTHLALARVLWAEGHSAAARTELLKILAAVPEHEAAAALLFALTGKPGSDKNPPQPLPQAELFVPQQQTQLAPNAAPAAPVATPGKLQQATLWLQARAAQLTELRHKAADAGRAGRVQALAWWHQLRPPAAAEQATALAARREAEPKPQPLARTSPSARSAAPAEAIASHMTPPAAPEPATPVAAPAEATPVPDPDPAPAPPSERDAPPAPAPAQVDQPGAQTAGAVSEQFPKKDFVALMQLGSSRQAQQDWAGAQRAYSAAAQLAPQRPEGLLAAGNASLQVQDGRAAEMHYRAALSAQPRLADGHFGLAQALQLQSRRSDAMRAYRRFLSIAPDDARAPACRAALAQLGQGE